MNILHTTTEAVRTALGVTEKEISDNQLRDLNIQFQLEVEIDDVYPDHAAAVTAGQEPSATADEIRLYKIITLYCQYEGACFVLPAIQNFAYQKISDGGFEFQRFAKDNIEETRREITGLRDKYKGLLSELYTGDAPSSVSLVAVVSPTFNPVTNEGAEV